MPFHFIIWQNTLLFTYINCTVLRYDQAGGNTDVLILGVWGNKVDEAALERTCFLFLAYFVVGVIFFIMILLKIQTCECLP